MLNEIEQFICSLNFKQDFAIQYYHSIINRKRMYSGDLRELVISRVIDDIMEGKI